ncbi:MAG: SDR family oxidoreductase [Candidatus Aureabacteria bacterium]|nr:SDR family oxidoreductase [Candidatus Auribacterota bacterium]MCK5160141.1 SDR family oxidoreductase [Candidatus Auribacterota bacterium]
MRLDGKIALVTGASRGIGKAIAAAIIEAGGTVIVTYKKNKDLAREVAERDKKGKSIAVQMDVSDRLSVKKAKDIVINKFGHLDIFVNNAGINKPNDFEKITDNDWENVLDVNLKGPFIVTQEFLSMMKEKGSIINISSVSGQYGGPRTTHYAVSKAGLIAFTQNLAIFCARKKIRVNAVSPGLIESEMAKAAKGLSIEEKILLGRLGTPEEVAKAVLFLASDDASYITGHTLNVNGGIYF